VIAIVIVTDSIVFLAIVNIIITATLLFLEHVVILQSVEGMEQRFQEFVIHHKRAGQR
jgi:hypothetical protein